MYINPSPKGFTLLETLIALGIVTIGGLAVFTLLQQALRVSRINKEIIVSANLAREGIEIVRGIRDSAGNGFNALTNGNYVVDSFTNYNLDLGADSPSIATCNNCRIYFENGKYTHVATGSATVYKRMVTIADGNHIVCDSTADCEKVITVSVLRDGTSIPYRLVEYLTDWRR